MKEKKYKFLKNIINNVKVEPWINNFINKALEELNLEIEKRLSRIYKN